MSSLGREGGLKVTYMSPDEKLNRINGSLSQEEMEEGSRQAGRRMTMLMMGYWSVSPSSLSLSLPLSFSLFLSLSYNLSYSRFLSLSLSLSLSFFLSPSLSIQQYTVCRHRRIHQPGITMHRTRVGHDTEWTFRSLRQTSFGEQLDII